MQEKNGYKKVKLILSDVWVFLLFSFGFA